MPSSRDRAISILDLLAHHGAGMTLAEIVEALDIPKAAAFRTLSDLRDEGYVVQERNGGPYRPGLRIVTMAFAYLASSGIDDIVQPILNRLADQFQELVRIAVVEGHRLIWVAKAQGKQKGLRVDADDGAEVYLAAASNGHAWLSCLPKEKALQLVLAQGFPRQGYGPSAPQTIDDLWEKVSVATTRGYALVIDSYELGTSAIAVPIKSGAKIVGTLSIAGPSIRMSEDRMITMVSEMQTAAADLAILSRSGSQFRRAED